MNYFGHDAALEKKHLVNLPVSKDFYQFIGNFTIPDFAGGFKLASVWMAGITIAIVASLESLLSIEATDKLDPQKRLTPLNRELYAQGIGNIVSGSLGGLPITAVIVRSSANIMAGAQTKLAAIFHGVLLLISVMLFPALLNYIPLSTLAVILIFTGYKLAKPAVFKEVFNKGYDSFIPFLVTILAILFSDLLKGIAVGMFVGMIYVFKSNMHLSMVFTHDNGNYLIRFIKDVTFFNKATFRKYLAAVPKNSSLIIDMRKPVIIDDDIIEIIAEYKTTATSLNIQLEILRDVHQNQNSTTTII